MNVLRFLKVLFVSVVNLTCVVCAVAAVVLFLGEGVKHVYLRGGAYGPGIAFVSLWALSLRGTYLLGRLLDLKRFLYRDSL